MLPPNLVYKFLALVYFFIVHLCVFFPYFFFILYLRAVLIRFVFCLCGEFACILNVMCFGPGDRHAEKGRRQVRRLAAPLRYVE